MNPSSCSCRFKGHCISYSNSGKYLQSSASIPWS